MGFMSDRVLVVQEWPGYRILDIHYVRGDGVFLVRSGYTSVPTAWMALDEVADGRVVFGLPEVVSSSQVDAWDQVAVAGSVVRSSPKKAARKSKRKSGRK